MTRPGYGIWFILYFMLGCTSTAPVPEDRFYQIDVQAPAAAFPHPVLRNGLEVDYVSADPLRSGRAVLYRDAAKPLELQRYHYEFWVDQPPRMIHQALVQYLRVSGIADAVVDSAERADPAYRMRVRLLRFEQIVDRTSQGIEVELEVSLYSGSAGSPKWTEVYFQRQDSGGSDMHKTARAMQQALERIFHALLGDLAAFNAKHR